MAKRHTTVEKYVIFSINILFLVGRLGTNSKYVVNVWSCIGCWVPCLCNIQTWLGWTDQSKTIAYLSTANELVKVLLDATKVSDKLEF
jgi:hypothetical protein